MSDGKPSSSPTHSSIAFSGSFNAHRLSTTEEEISNTSQSSERSGTSTVTVIQATQPTDDTSALIPQQSQSVSTPPKPPVSFHARGFKGAHASFRLRMLQEQHGFEPVFISKKRTPRQQKLSEFKGGDLNKYTARSYAIQNGNEIFGANIQNEFGVCGWILTILSYILIFFTLPISACLCIKVVQEYERAVIFRLGRLMPGGAKGPGIFFIVPCIDTYRKVDLRVLSFEVPPQEILSKDSVTVAVDAVVYFRISNATISVTNVEDAARSTKLLAQTTLRNILGTKTLAEMLSDREAISLQMQSTLDEATEPWGVKVERVEVKDVRLPIQLQRAMASEAEAAREARAKVIVAEGEQKASRALKEAAEVIAESPSALQLRYLQTLNSISAEKNSTIIFPFPIDLLSSFLQHTAPKVEEPPPLPKKIRSCCLYKYPEWVQSMVGTSQTSTPGGHTSHSHAHPAPPSRASFPSTTFTSGRPPLLTSMREAQLPIHGSSSSSTTSPLLNSMPNQLDPGRLLDETRIERSHSSSVNARPRGSGGGSSLLKQAIANRMNPEMAARRESKESKNIPPSPLAKTNAVENVMLENVGDDKTSCSGFTASSMETVKLKKEVKNIGADENDIMNKSILTNPAWYRDDDGRTGFKPKEWEGVKGEQRSQVKDLSKQSVDQRSENKQPSNKMQLNDLLKSVSPERHSDHVISKSPSRSKAGIASQRDGTTSNDQRVSTGTERVVQPGFSEKTKLGAIGRGGRLAKVQKEQLRKRYALDDVTSRGEEQIKSRQEGTISPEGTTASDGLQKQIQQEQPSESDVKSVDSIRRLPLKPTRLNGVADEALRMTATSTNSGQQETPNNNVRPQTELTCKQDRTTKAASFTITSGARSEQSSTSDSSVPNQNMSTDVNGVLAKRGVFKDQTCSPSSLRPELSDRRDSSLSESSRLSGFSHKSVTFSDRVEVTEIEGREKKRDISNYRKYLDDNDETSDEEERSFTRPRISPRRQLRSKQIKANIEEFVGEHDIEANTLNEDSFKNNHIHKDDDNEGRLVGDLIEERNSKGISLTPRDTRSSVSQGKSHKKPIYGPSSPLTSSSTSDSSPIEEDILDSQKQNYMHTAIYTDSQRTLYEGDIYGPDRVQYFNEEEYDSLENLPTSVRQAIIDEHIQQLQNENYVDDRWIPLFGSMSRLHNISSQSSSIASFPMMPRSASGYFDISPENAPMDHAVDNHKSMENFESEANMEQLQASYYENVPFNGQADSRERSLTPTALTTDDLCIRTATRRSTPTRQMEKRRYDSIEGSDDSTIVEEPAAIHAQVGVTKEPSSISGMRISSPTSQPALLHVRTSNEQPSLQSITIKQHDGSPYETSSVKTEGNRCVENHVYPDTSPIDIASGSSQPSIPSNEIVLATSQELAKDQQEFYNLHQRPHESDISLRDDGTFDANLSKEERLRLQFVARFGGIRAPIERMESDGEEYPIDRNYRKSSYDSMASSNSRESVVSAASARAEILLRRNFNY